jgi:hypothetical protein
MDLCVACSLLTYSPLVTTNNKGSQRAGFMSKTREDGSNGTVASFREDVVPMMRGRSSAGLLAPELKGAGETSSVGGSKRRTR